MLKSNRVNHFEKRELIEINICFARTTSRPGKSGRLRRTHSQFVASRHGGGQYAGVRVIDAFFDATDFAKRATRPPDSPFSPGLGQTSSSL